MSGEVEWGLWLSRIASNFRQGGAAAADVAGTEKLLGNAKRAGAGAAPPPARLPRAWRRRDAIGVRSFSTVV